VTLNGAPPPSRGIELGIRPEHLHIFAGGSGQLDGRIRLVEHLGSATLLHIRCPRIEADLRLQVAGSPPWQAGQEIAIAFPAEDCTLFDASGAAVAYGT
jgi:multiple sugar transport system ATP-binding protein